MSLVYTNGLVSVMDGTVDLLTDQIDTLLVTGTYTPAQTDDFISDVTNELSGTGYSRKTLTSKSVAADTGNVRAYFKAGNVTWAAINAGTAAAVILAAAIGADSVSPLLVYIDSGGFPIATNGGDLTITWNASGIFYI